MRSEVAIFMHVQSRPGLAVPIYEIDGSKNLFTRFPEFLEATLRQHSRKYDGDFDREITQYFNPEKQALCFCKTADRSVTAHMSQFSMILENTAYESGEITLPICAEAQYTWKKNLITLPGTRQVYTTPIEQWDRWFEDRYSVSTVKHTNSSNVIEFPNKNPWQ